MLNPSRTAPLARRWIITTNKCQSHCRLLELCANHMIAAPGDVMTSSFHSRGSFLLDKPNALVVDRLGPSATSTQDNEMVVNVMLPRFKGDSDSCVCPLTLTATFRKNHLQAPEGTEQERPLGRKTSSPPIPLASRCGVCKMSQTPG